MLLDLALKSDEVVEILEHYDLTVVYDFDRLRENTPDLYWASAHRPGFELRFNERQVLDTVFLYARPRGEFLGVDPELTDVPFYGSFADARRSFVQNDVAFQEESQRNWIRGRFVDHSIHYEFDSDGALGLVTFAALPSA